MTYLTDQRSTAGSTAFAASSCFVQALCIDSNLEMDWLWLATQNISAIERTYSLRRALAINPDSTLAKQALRGLPDVPSIAVRDFGMVWQHC